jgi:predicted ATP-grasp superfamily ATP-dependent carboligase
MSIPADHYVQQYIPGQSLSAVYRADGWAAQLLGVTEQLIGQARFGADGFAYCGSIGPLPLPDKAREAVTNLGVVLSQQYDLRGIFGVDLVMDRRQRLWPVEINPRYPASTEIVEQMTGVSALQSMQAHRRQRSRTRAQRQRTFGKALLFTTSQVTVPDLYDVLPEHALADAPMTGQVRDRGQPICTIFATEPTRDTCEQTLHKRADAVYRALEMP